MLNGLYMNSVVGTHLLFTTIRGFLKIDHSDIDARVVLEQNRFSKKATPNRTRTLNPRTVVLISRVQSHALTTVLIHITSMTEMIIIKSYSIDLSLILSVPLSPKIN